MSIPIERYRDPASLDQELERIFWRRCFVAHESEINNVNDYVSFRLGARSLTLRRFSHAIVLLDNVCRHRSNLIDPPGTGNRPFRCGYHGWTYDADGSTSFIPFGQEFSKLPSPLETFETCGVSGFQFKSEQETSLRSQQFGSLLTRLPPPSGTRFHRGQLRHHCNWKLLVENVLEAYHLSIVHPETFGKAGFTSSSIANVDSVAPDSMLTIFPHDPGRRQGKLVGLLGYKHVYVFPNLFVSVTNDLIYYVASFIPTAPTETVLEYRLFATDKFHEQRAPVQEFLKLQAIEFTEQTLNEDKEILERCQIGMESSTGNYTLGPRESRIDAFHAAYVSWL